MKQQSQQVAAMGRAGDDVLVHMNRMELSELNDMLGGTMTVNPDTGNPEAFLPFLAGLFGGLGAAGTAAGVGATAAGLAATAAPAAAAAAAPAAAGLAAAAPAATTLSAALPAAATALPTAATAAAPTAASALAPTAASALAPTAATTAGTATPGILGSTTGTLAGDIAAMAPVSPTAAAAAPTSAVLETAPGVATVTKAAPTLPANAVTTQAITPTAMAQPAPMIPKEVATTAISPESVPYMAEPGAIAQPPVDMLPPGARVDAAFETVGARPTSVATSELKSSLYGAQDRFIDPSARVSRGFADMAQTPTDQILGMEMPYSPQAPGYDPNAIHALPDQAFNISGGAGGVPPELVPAELQGVTPADFPAAAQAPTMPPADLPVGDVAVTAQPSGMQPAPIDLVGDMQPLSPATQPTPTAVADLPPASDIPVGQAPYDPNSPSPFLESSPQPTQASTTQTAPADSLGPVDSGAEPYTPRDIGPTDTATDTGLSPEPDYGTSDYGTSDYGTAEVDGAADPDSLGGGGEGAADDGDRSLLASLKSPDILIPGALALASLSGGGGDGGGEEEDEDEEDAPRGELTPAETTVEFPDESYRPGVDPEFDYFPIPKFQEGGMVQNAGMMGQTQDTSPFGMTQAPQQNFAPMGQSQMQPAQPMQPMQPQNQFGMQAPMMGSQQPELPMQQQQMPMFQEGGMVGARDQDPRINMIMDAEAALTGQHPNPDQAIQAFIDAFGEVAFQRLQQAVAMKAQNQPRMVEGPGGPTDDMIPARIDGVEEARLSDGEVVMTANAVRNAGGGDPYAGADRLMQLNAALEGKDPNSAALNIERVPG